MKTLVTLSVAMVLCFGAIGCNKPTTEKKTETTTKTPSGETKTTTDTQTTEKK